MAPWMYSADKYNMNLDKMIDQQHHHEGFHPRTRWNYEVMLHRCGFKGKLGSDDAKALHRMLEGDMYDEEAFRAMETPLLELLVSLRGELKSADRVLYGVYERKWFEMSDQMWRKRDSSHRKLKEGQGRRNEYIIFFQRNGF